MADKPARTGREIILLAIRNVVLGALLLAAVAYAVDYAVLRFRIATDRNAMGTVTVHPVYAVPQKITAPSFWWAIRRTRLAFIRSFRTWAIRLVGTSRGTKNSK